MKGKNIWRDDRVRVIGGKYNGKEGVVVERTPRRGLTLRVRVVLDDRSNDGRRMSVTFPVSEVELVKPGAIHTQDIRNKLLRAARRTDD